jgi:hypothetical protein
MHNGRDYLCNHLVLKGMQIWLQLAYFNFFCSKTRIDIYNDAFMVFWFSYLFIESFKIMSTLLWGNCCFGMNWKWKISLDLRICHKYEWILVKSIAVQWKDQHFSQYSRHFWDVLVILLNHFYVSFINLCIYINPSQKFLPHKFYFYFIWKRW